MKPKIAQNLSYRFLKNFGSKRDSPEQINCENFVICCTVGFWAILDQRQVFTTLDENWIAHALYLSVRSCDAIYRVRESKSKLELFYRMFTKLFCHIFLTLSLNICLNGVWNYRCIYQRDLRRSIAELVFVTSLGYLRHFCTRDKYWRVVGNRSARY